MEREACEVLHGFNLNRKYACVCVQEVPVDWPYSSRTYATLQGCASQTHLNDDEELFLGAEEPQRCLQGQLGSNGTTHQPTEPETLEALDASLPPLLISLGQGRSGLIRSRDVFPLQGLIFTPSCKLKPFSTRFAALISAAPKATVFFSPLSSIWTARGETLYFCDSTSASLCLHRRSVQGLTTPLQILIRLR